MREQNLKMKSFTLVEVLVSVTIFTIVISVVLGMTSFAIKIQAKNLSDQYMLNQVDYTMEYLSRQLRMAQRNDTGADIAGRFGTCKSDCTYNFDGMVLSFLDHDGTCQEIYVNSDHVLVYGEAPITSDKFEILDFNINLENPCKSNIGQPKITFTFKIRKKNSSENPFQLQTTISQRNLNL